MTMSAIFATVLLMGFTCSMGCGTVSTPFLLGSLLGDGGNISQSRRAIALFSLGKIVSLMSMGLLASIFGNMVLTAVEGLYPQATIWVIRIATLAFGLKILYSTLKYEFFPQKVAVTACASCSSCPSAGGCGSKSEMPSWFKGKTSYFLAGLLYATIPCGPLLTCLTYASTMNSFTAMALLGAFALVNSIIPVFFFASLVGMANGEMQKDSKDFLKYVKLSGGLILIYASIFQV